MTTASFRYRLTSFPLNCQSGTELGSRRIVSPLRNISSKLRNWIKSTHTTHWWSRIFLIQKTIMNIQGSTSQYNVIHHVRLLYFHYHWYTHTHTYKSHDDCDDSKYVRKTADEKKKNGWIDQKKMKWKKIDENRNVLLRWWTHNAMWRRHITMNKILKVSRVSLSRHKSSRDDDVVLKDGGATNAKVIEMNWCK